jgi:hypothetical protein
LGSPPQVVDHMGVQVEVVDLEVVDTGRGDP